MAFRKILYIDYLGHLDAYKNITYIMKRIYMLALHVYNAISTIITETFIMASMLLTRLAGRYYGVHRAFCVSRLMHVLDGVSKDLSTIIISMRIIFQLKTYICDVHVYV